MNLDNLEPVARRCFVALLPPLEVEQYANGVIRELSDRYATSTAKVSPHVTLQPPFEWLMGHLGPLEACLTTFAKGQASTLVRLSGFGAFKPRVLFINVVKTPELLALQSNLQQQLHTALDLVHPHADRPFVPHLTVASRHLTPLSFQQAWAELQARPVEFEFNVDRLTLLVHTGQRWQVHSTFALGE